MGQSDDSEDPTYKKHQDVCEKLNMDATAAKDAWESYEKIKENYTLEGEQLHWIGCALYAACRNATNPTVGVSTTNVEGNCVSLTRLLKLCNLPLMEFFKKSKLWADMTNMPENFSARIDKLQTNFSVSSIIFQKYQPIFLDIFKDPTEDLLSRQPKSRRHRVNPCRPSKLFEFGWSLFICIKGGISTISDDLVNSFHLLLVVCDMLFSNAVLANRRDLLRPDFSGLPENFDDDNFTATSAPCIINLLCEKHGAVAVEASVIKELLKKYMTKLFNERVLKGDQNKFSGILETLNFDQNYKFINKNYEQRMLSAGDFDERIFLAEWKRKKLSGLSQLEAGGGEMNHISRGSESINNIGSPNRILNESIEPTAKNNQFNSINPLAPPTPLTGRKYLKSKESVTNSLLMINPTQSVVHLQSLLVGCKPTPSENLLKVFENCTAEVKSFVENKMQELGKKFCEAYSKKSDEGDNPSLDFGKQRLQSAQKLFYKILEMVLSDEKLKKPNFEPQTLLQNELFLQCLFSCCCEIVIYSYQNKDRTFPWILSVLELEAFHFYRVIESIVRVAVDHLSREMVKHLNRIEETILESLAWKSNSSLWQKLEEPGTKVPRYEEVALPGTFDLVDPNTPGQPVLRKMALDRGILSDPPQSPTSSMSDRFHSPIAPTGLAKKRLFSSNEKVGATLKQQKIITVDGNQVVVTISEPISPQNTNGLMSSTPIHPGTINRDQSKPRKTGSLALFFRKFYNLTNTRMQNLCGALNITEVDLKRKIWTIFEYSIKEKTNLMKDRHLDQILMSAVYVICKIGKLDNLKFTEIMRCYRNQPQAESHIYRSVLITKNTEQNQQNAFLENGNSAQGNRTPPTPNDMAGTSHNYGSEVRGDLIKFYNTVYVPQVQQFATKSGLGEGDTPNLTLSPLPKARMMASSPVRRINGSLMTRVLDPKEIVASPAPQLHYLFNRSPAKDLEEINRMVTQIDARKLVSKRLLADDSELPLTDLIEPPVKKNSTTQFVAKKFESIIDDRRTQNP